MTVEEQTIFAEPEDRAARTQALEDALDQRILVLDGATGTALQVENLTADDFGGPELEGCNENLNLVRPDVVRRLHSRYLEAGADIVETNSFGGAPLVLAEYDLEARWFEINRSAAVLAREACREFETAERPRFVCGSIGPTTKAISVTGGVTFEGLIDNFRQQALGLMAGGADYLLLETCQDTRNVKAGLIGLQEAFDQNGWSLPIAVSATIEATGTMLAGQDAEALAVSLLHADLLYVGLNCATGPSLMAEHLRTLSELVRTRVACVPNAGLPDEDGLYNETPEFFREVFDRFLGEGWLNLVGGCCGTTPEHVTTLAELVRSYAPRRPSDHHRAMVSGIEAAELTEDNRPLLVGERTNVLGSRKFRRLVESGDFERAAEVGRAQARGGAQVLDVCMQDPDREEIADMEGFLGQLVKMVKLPLMIDTTDAAVMERALTYCQGKAVLNSINLEDGRERFEKVMPLVQRFGAAVIVGTIDEKGMAVTVERKLKVARRSHRILTEEYGLRDEDIWWDALVFPCGTGDPDYIGSAGQTLAGITALKSEFPRTKTVLGVSNVSFGLPGSGREVLNSVFLYRATTAGLDAAIVNTERLARYAEVPETERQLAATLLELEYGDVEGSDRAVAEFAAYFRGRSSAVASVSRETLPLEERISRAVIEGSKEGLDSDLASALGDERWPEPLDIINGPLMTGMSEVGRLFNSNQLIVAEVLQSAEVMKAAVSFLEPHMEQGSAAGRGKVLLATVKGDVHDIGKNLVDIILSNNGFEVVNLGIKVPSEVLIREIGSHQPDVVGLSGLLVKSAQQMVKTAEDFSAVGIEVPLVVGGAALTRRFTHGRIAPAYQGPCTYARDAMHGLELVERLVDPDKRGALLIELDELLQADQAPAATKSPVVAPSGVPLRRVRRDIEAPLPPDLDRHVERLDLDAVWEQVNPQMLFGKHLGLSGSVAAQTERGDPKLAKLERLIDELKEIARGGALEAHSVWQFFPVEAEGDLLRLMSDNGGGSLASWNLPRQTSGDQLCLTDYVVDGTDHIALLVTTARGGSKLDGESLSVTERVARWKDEGEYLKSHAFAALALETAEAAAELVHQRLRAAWGFPDPPDLAPKDRFAARYRGKRFSFGYPACPDLSGQRQLFEVLEPETIGVSLTEGEMMDPEASVSALVFHHPEAKYFGV